MRRDAIALGSLLLVLALPAPAQHDGGPETGFKPPVLKATTDCASSDAFFLKIEGDDPDNPMPLLYVEVVETDTLGDCSNGAGTVRKELRYAPQGRFEKSIYFPCQAGKAYRARLISFNQIADQSFVRVEEEGENSCILCVSDGPRVVVTLSNTLDGMLIFSASATDTDNDLTLLTLEVFEFDSDADCTRRQWLGTTPFGTLTATAGGGGAPTLSLAPMTVPCTPGKRYYAVARVEDAAQNCSQDITPCVCCVNCTSKEEGAAIEPRTAVHRSDASTYGRLSPGRLRDAGTLHLSTGTWTRGRGRTAAPQEGPQTRVYDNTCFWTGASANTVLYCPIEACSDVYDEGRIPSGGVAGATVDNLISSISFAHVTFAPVGEVDVELTFYDQLGGDCAGFTSPTPPEPSFAGQFRLSSASGFTLPGDPLGLGTAWTVTLDLTGGNEFCLESDGDGTAGNGNDLFNWRFRHFNSTVVLGRPGPVLAGEPLTGGFGSCTYTMTGAQACGSDPTFGPCGTGLDTTDGFWLNVDGDPSDGAASNTSCVCCLDEGTGCFLFGGWPGNPWASHFLTLDSAGSCGGTIPPPVLYCSGKTTSSGCIPFLSTSGSASVAGTGPFGIRHNDGVPDESGVLIYSFKKANLNFHGGKLCVKAPFVRTGAKAAKNGPCANASATCTVSTCGTMNRNFNATIQSGNDPALTSGQTVSAQWRQRDPVAPFGDNLSNGVGFVIAP